MWINRSNLVSFVLSFKCLFVFLTLHRSSVVSSMTDLQTFSTFGTQTLSNKVLVVGEQSLLRIQWPLRQGVKNNNYLLNKYIYIFLLGMITIHFLSLTFRSNLHLGVYSHKARRQLDRWRLRKLLYSHFSRWLHIYGFKNT